MHLKPAIVLDKRRVSTVGDNAGKYHIKIRVTFTGTRAGEKVWIQKYYRTGLFCTVKGFKTLDNPRTTELQQIKSKLIKLQAKAIDIVENNSMLTPELFEKEFTGSGGYDNVISLFQTIIDQKEHNGDVGTASSYKSAMQSVAKFGGDNISFAEINETWLKRYEASMLKADRSYTSIGIYLRSLRAVFNYAITIRKITADLYPFKRYKIPTSQGMPRALTEAQKNALMKFKTDNQELQRALDFWKFSYLSYGLSMTDICRLRRKDIKDDNFVIIRHKTRNTNRVRKSLVIPVHKEALGIINRWGSRSLAPLSYIFPTLEDGLTPKQEVNRIKDFIKDLNTGLKQIAKDDKLKITLKLTTYTARHTFATVIRNKGIGKEYIQEALGHSNIQTTENYLDNLDVKTRKKISGLL
jgi:integrase/recombinase XerD